MAEPAVFSDSLTHEVKGDLEASASASGAFPSPIDHMRSVVQHSIQAALGAEKCNGPKLAQALKVSIILTSVFHLAEITAVILS